MLIDRSRIETRHLCPVKRYWNYDFLVTGIVPEPTGDISAADVGTSLHAGMLAMLQGRSIEESCHMATDNMGVQNKYLIEGMLRGFHSRRLPEILNHYEILELEIQHNVELGKGVFMPLRRDVVVRRKADKQKGIIDYKTLSYYTDSWELILENSLQTLLYTYCAEKLDNERYIGVQYEGFVKGKKSDDGKVYSPYCFMYTDGKEYSVKYTNRKGWSRQPVWETFTPLEWSKHLEAQNAYEKLFQTVVPRRPMSHIMETIVSQVVDNELLYHRFLREGNGEKFRFLEMKPSACFKYGVNYPCPFYRLCFGAEGIENIKEIPDGFVVRQPHHEEEL